MTAANSNSDGLFLTGLFDAVSANPFTRDGDGEHNFFGFAGFVVSATWIIVAEYGPRPAHTVAKIVSATYGMVFSGAGQLSDRDFTVRDGFELAGGMLGGAVGGAVGGFVSAGAGTLIGGYAGGQAGGYLGGTVYDYMFDSGATPVQPPPIIVEQTRQSRITSTDSGIQARYDNPQYDAQTADGNGVTRAYVDAYAQGDLKTAAQLLVGHGANIYPSAANGFYADAIIRQMAGYAGGITPTTNQTRARDTRDAMGNDGNPNTYPDAIIRQVAAGQNHASAQPQKVKDAAAFAAWQQEFNWDRQRGVGRHATRSASSRPPRRNSPIARQHRREKNRAQDEIRP